MAKVAVSEKALKILNYLKENDGKNLTAQDIADALDMEVKSVNPTITSGLQKKGYTVREEAQVEATMEDGSTKYVDVKFIKLTDAGRSYDHDKAIATDVAAATAAAKGE